MSAPKFTPSRAIIVDAIWGGYEIVDPVSNTHAKTPSGGKFWSSDRERAADWLAVMRAAEARAALAKVSA
jgi:hypothetical protein